MSQLLQQQLVRLLPLPKTRRNVQGAQFVPPDSKSHLAIRGIINFYDFRIRLDVRLDTERLGDDGDGTETIAYSVLEGMCLGPTPQVVSRERAVLFHPVLPERHALKVPSVSFKEDDANARHTIDTDTFRAIVQAIPKVYRVTPRVLLLRITSPFKVDDSLLEAFVSILGMKKTLFWESKEADWRTIQVAAEPKLETSWPDTFELAVDHIHEDSEKKVFSLTAKSYCFFAGLRLSCSRLFPFVIDLDDEFEPHLQKGLPLFLVDSFVPSISIEGISIPTNESLEHAGVAMTTLGGRRLYNPDGVPGMHRTNYKK
jgi:hypothetical protein